MKKKFTLTFSLLAITLASMAQNQITTPNGQPLIIGNQGVKLSNLNSNSTTQPTNGKVLSVDANGLIFLAPDAGGSGSSSPWTPNGSNIYFNTGNVGLGTDTPLQRLDVNGDINIPGTNGIRINNVPFLRAPGTENIFLGANSGPASPSGAGGNVHIGPSAGSVNNGANNVFIGIQAGLANTTASSNTFIGWKSGKSNTEGFYNTFLGPGAGENSTTANYNTFIGPFAGNKNTGGEKNMFIGVSAGADNTSGSFNLFIGFDAGRKNIGASNNAFLGNQAGSNTTVGSSNTFIGANAGMINVSGFSNTAIGADANFGSANLSNATAIGSNAVVNQNNSIVLGNLTAAVGIGNSAPTARLHVTTGGSLATGVRLEGLPTSSGTIYPLYVDGSGNVMRGNSSGARESSLESLESKWTLTEDSYLINSNTGGVIIGTDLATTPAGYKLYVSEGILTERIKVAVKSTADWRDNVLKEDYPLRSIEDVELYIKKHSHLPGVPSAQEMVENGNDIQKTDAILLEKIEELMLYIIDLKKQNAHLQNESNKQNEAIRSLATKVLEIDRK